MSVKTAFHNYEQFPRIQVSTDTLDLSLGFSEIAGRLKKACHSPKTVLVVECYPGVNQEELLDGLLTLSPSLVIHSDDLAFEPEKIDDLLEKDLLPDDPVFGIFTIRRLSDYFYPEKLAQAAASVDALSDGLILIYGVGASLVHPGDITVLADLTRWEIQLRYRRGMNNWRTAKKDLPRLSKYKRGFFAEWRWADKEKEKLLPILDFYLDMTVEGSPVMAEGNAYRDGIRQISRRPFRMVPYFDPGVWGGNWMKEQFDLPENGSNYAWSFDGVPEENSLMLGFGERTLQTPAQNLVFLQPRSLLGERVHARFGKEFPIRFDMLDTINGQNLSLQVHPLTEYIQEQFNMRYTQDESYYILDTKGDDSCVWLGIKSGTNPSDMTRDLERAQQGECPFPAEKYVNCIPVKKHDHVLIPAGTVHCSGANTMVLEISATPYIFTFKLWDWNRLDLDGKPRPVHLKHGLANIQWDRTTSWVQENLVDQAREVHRDDHCVVERTGLHEREFIDTYRISTAGDALIHRNGSVHVINLVEGEQIFLESPDHSFEPVPVHYAETCIIPEAAGDYRIVSKNQQPVKVILACVRN